MKVFIILEATLGGIRKHVVDLVIRLHDKGDQVTFVYSIRRADDRFMEDIELLQAKGVDCILLPMTKTIFNPVNILCTFQLIRLFRKKRPEVIHMHGAVAGALGRVGALFSRKARKIIYSPHGGVMHKINKSFRGRLYGFIEKVLNTKSVFFVAVSSDEKVKMRTFLNIEKSKIKLIPNGIDIQELKNKKYKETDFQEVRASLGIKESDLIFLYPALFLEAKGHSHFFNSFIEKNLSLDPHIHILLAGDGPLMHGVKAKVATLPFRSQVHFLGFTKNIELYFHLADAVLLPSLNEAFGYVLLEAMAFEKPIFATRVGGIKDIVIHNRNGLLYDVNRLEDMIADMNYYQHHRIKLKDFGRNAEQMVIQHFGLDGTTGRIRQFYAE